MKIIRLINIHKRKSLMTKVAIDGLANDVVPITREALERRGLAVVYCHESTPDELITPKELVSSMIASNPDIALVCNFRHYSRFLQNYTDRQNTPPLVVLTGGGPAFEEDARRFTPYVFGVPFTRSSRIKSWEQFANALEIIAAER